MGKDPGGQLEDGLGRAGSTVEERPSPHRFFTFEFIAYFMLVGFGVFYQIPFELGSELDRICLQSIKCTRRLKPGLPIFPGRDVDLSDHQWREFRESLPLLLAGMVAWGVARTCLMSFLPRAQVRSKAAVYAVVIAAVLCFLHGTAVVWPVLIAMGNFWIGSALQSSKFLPYATWAYCLAVLFGVHHWSGVMKFGHIHSALAALDSVGGLIRWHSVTNLFVLRMISFNLDRYWASTAAPRKPLPPDRTYRDMEKSNSTNGVLASPLLYFVYIFYIPLYFAGPVISANAFMEQFATFERRISLKTICVYAMRITISFLLFEWTTHYLYTFAVVYSGAWFKQKISPHLIALYGYTAVHLIWLKFLVIWRIFRLWALIDDVETIENMGGCVGANGSVRGFWTIWHKSFNRWLVRYLYVPLGGNGNYVLSVFATFTFTAMWHDLEFHLLLWGWMMAVVVVPELYLAKYLPSALRKKWYYRHLAAAGMTLNTILIISINLLGFSMGTDVGDDMLYAFAGRDGLYYLSWSVVYVFCAMQWVHEISRLRAGK